MTNIKKTRKELMREIKDLKASLIHTYHFASIALEKTSTDHMMGSSITLELTALGGRQLILPVAIRDGLSKETIIALQRDLKRSYDLSIELKPKTV